MLYDTSATTEELRRAKIDLAMVPIGAVEQHSHHLPIGTDWMSAEAMARRVAEELAIDRDVYLLPALPYSLSQCHGPMPGTVWLTPRTLGDVLRDVVESLLRQGIRRIVVLNGHGGNFVLDDEIRELNLRHPAAIVLSASAWEGGGGGPSGRVVGGDIHSGAGETSTMLALDPEHVQEERIDNIPPVGREFLDYAYMCQISPHGAWGRPSAGTAEAGQAGFREGAAHLARSIVGALEQIVALRGVMP